jgi:hypothetical protein
MGLLVDFSALFDYNNPVLPKEPMDKSFPAIFSGAAGNPHFLPDPRIHQSGFTSSA